MITALAGAGSAPANAAVPCRKTDVHELIHEPASCYIFKLTACED